MMEILTIMTLSCALVLVAGAVVMLLSETKENKIEKELKKSIHALESEVGRLTGEIEKLRFDTITAHNVNKERIWKLESDITDIKGRAEVQKGIVEEMLKREMQNVEDNG